MTFPGAGSWHDARPTPPSETTKTADGFTANRRRFLSWGGLAAGAVMVGGLGACGTAATGRSNGKAGGGSTRGNGNGTGINGGDGGDGHGAVTRKGAGADTFFVAGFQWGPPASFNPLNTAPAWPAGGGSVQLIFETLVRFNLVTGELEPGLATGIKEVDKRTMEVALQEGTKWQDGQDLTADDVKFTFDLAKKVAVSYSAVWQYLQEVKIVDDRTVRFIAKAKPLNPLTIKNTISGTYILPQHIFEPWVNDNSAASQKFLKPVGSGPFSLKLADQTQIELTRVDNYWGKDIYGTPPMSTITHPIFKGAPDGDLQFEEGNIDASQQFTTQIWKMWQDKGAPVGTWLNHKPYYLPGSIPMLQFNTTKKGLDNPKVRLAIAYAIDTATIVATAMSSYSSLPQASLILPTGFEKTYFDQAAVDSQGWKHDPDKAKSILEDDLGATKGSDGIYKLKDGTRLGPWTLITPTGWTDWNAACEVTAKNLQAIGIDVATRFPEAGTVSTAIQNGNFDMCCWSPSGVSPASPWSRFQDILDWRIGAPIGKTAFANYTRFKDPSVPALLDAAAEATTDADRKTAYGKIDALYRKNVPTVPLMYRPLEFYEFQTGTWTNFPTATNPYAPPMWQGAGVKWLFKIKKQEA